MNLFSGKRILVLIAHPDDEVVGVAAALMRVRAAGAKTYGVYLSHGCLAKDTLWRWERSTYETMVAQRFAEAQKAADYLGLDIVGPQPTRAAREIWPHLQAVHDDVLNAMHHCRADVVWAPAYEGGNPDHDALNALAITLKGPMLYEYSEYHYAGQKNHSNDFIMKRGDEMMITLCDDERVMKRKTLKFYASEQKNLGSITCQQEMLRPLKAYDYSRPPHIGTLGYARFAWVPFRHPRVDFTKPEAVSAAITTFLETRQR